jgi:hypothetical protein
MAGRSLRLAGSYRSTAKRVHPGHDRSSAQSRPPVRDRKPPTGDLPATGRTLATCQKARDLEAKRIPTFDLPSVVQTKGWIMLTLGRREVWSAGHGGVAPVTHRGNLGSGYIGSFHTLLRRHLRGRLTNDLHPEPERRVVCRWCPNRRDYDQQRTSSRTPPR